MDINSINGNAPENTEKKPNIVVTIKINDPEMLATGAPAETIFEGEGIFVFVSSSKDDVSIGKGSMCGKLSPFELAHSFLTVDRENYEASKHLCQIPFEVLKVLCK